jgi:ABC-type transporter Mla subunit MlaD
MNRLINALSDLRDLQQENTPAFQRAMASPEALKTYLAECFHGPAQELLEFETDSQQANDQAEADGMNSALATQFLADLTAAQQEMLEQVILPMEASNPSEWAQILPISQEAE